MVQSWVALDEVGEVNKICCSGVALDFFCEAFETCCGSDPHSEIECGGFRWRIRVGFFGWVLNGRLCCVVLIVW